jgi:hypothetical protein
MILDLLTPSGINSKIIAALFVAVGREGVNATSDQR